MHSELADQIGFGGWRKPLVDDQGSVSVVPDALQDCENSGGSIDVDCNELAHANSVWLNR